jgi:transposase-like protein
MAVANPSLDWCTVGAPIPLDDVAKEFAVSPRTLWTWVGQFGLTKYRMPGKGKLTYLDPDEVRRKVKAVPKQPRSAG